MANSVYQCKRFYDTGVLTVPSWYDVSHSFVEALSEEVPDEIRRDDNVTPDFTGLKRIWNDHHAAMLDNQKWWIIIGSLLIFLALVYTIFSIVYCICLCRRKPSVKDDSSGAACKRTTLNVTLFILLVLGMCFLAFMLISSTDAKMNAARLPTYLSICSGDVNTYVSNAQQEADTALRSGFKRLADEAKASVQALINSTENERKANQDTPSTDPLLGSLTREIDEMKRRHRPLQTSFTKLDKLKNQLEPLPKKLKTHDCKAEPDCSMVVNRIQGVLGALHILKANLTFAVPEARDLPRKTDAIELLEEQIALHGSYDSFLQNKQQTQTDLLTTVSKEMTVAQTQLDAISKGVSLKAASVTGFPQQVRDYVDENGSTYANRIRYAWAGIILIGMVLFAILLLYTIGLAFGCFGKSPSDEKRSCVRTTGRTFYTVAIIVLAVIAILLALVTTLMMLFGAAVQAFICGPLQDPFTDPLVNKFTRQKHPTIAQVLQACGDPDATLFAALDLHKDLVTISDDVHKSFERIQFQPPLKPDIPPNTSVLLPIFAKGTITFVNQLFSDFNKSTTIDDLKPAEATLQSAVRKVEETRRVVRNMQHDWQEFADAFKIVVKKLTNIQLSNTGLRRQLQKGVNTAESEADEILRLMHERATAYISNVNITLNQILPCQPFKHIVENSADAACRYVVDPFNGTWLALLLCLVTTIIIAFLSTCASRTYYRRKKQRPVRQWIPPPISVIPESLMTDEPPPAEDVSAYRPRKVPWTPQWEPATVNATQPSRNELLV